MNRYGKSKNHKPGLSPGEGLTYTPSNDATYTEAFNDYLKKRNINRNQAIGELITIALQTLKDSYDLPDPTAVHYMNNQIPIYPSPNLINHSREIPKSTSKIIEEKQDDTSNPLKKRILVKMFPWKRRLRTNEKYYLISLILFLLKKVLKLALVIRKNKMILLNLRKLEMIQGRIVQI